MPQHTLTDSMLLYGADGHTINPIILKHERDFTLLFLRATITVTPLKGHALVGNHLLTGEEMPKLLIAGNEPLTIRPSVEEVEEYGRVKKPAHTHGMAEHGQTSDYLEAQFVKRFRYASVRQALGDKIDMQRSVLALAMERVLDCVQTNDVDAFMLAQRDMEVAIQLGIRMLDPELKEAGVKKSERVSFFETLGESQIKTAIRQRLAAIKVPAAQEALYASYEKCMHAYKEELDYRKTAPRVHGPLNGGASEREPHAVVQTPSIEIQGKAVSASNDNERT